MELGTTDGKVLCTVLVNVDGIKLGNDVETEPRPLDELLMVLMKEILNVYGLKVYWDLLMVK